MIDVWYVASNFMDNKIDFKRILIDLRLESQLFDSKFEFI